DPPDGVERFGRLVGLGGRGGRGRDDDHRRGEEAFHLMSALMTAGGSHTVGSTVSNSTVSRVIFCSIPMNFCVSTVACVSLPNCLYPPSVFDIVIVPICVSRVLMLPARRPVTAS